jgi:hypothetical protein
MKKQLVITLCVAFLIFVAAGATISVLAAHQGQQAGLHPCGALYQCR